MSPSSPTIDAHQHLWNLESGLYDWPTPAEPAIHRTFEAEELAAEIADADVDATVIVQVTDSLADTDAMLAAAHKHGWILGVVGWLPLESPDAAERALAGRRDRLRGIRHLIHRESDPEWLRRKEVQPGLALIADAGLPFDVVAVFPDHLRLTSEVAAAHPNLDLVIDHLAKPPFRSAGWRRWVDEIRGAAASPRVYAKVSGLDTAAGPGWTVDELRPAWDVALEAFGPDRLLFGSDWPVCRMVSSYAEVVTAARTLVAELSADEQRMVMSGTAIKVYRLDVPGLLGDRSGA